MRLSFTKFQTGNRRHAKWASLLVALVASTCLISCDRAKKIDSPNVLFIVLDTTRADHLSLYGHDKPTTPFLDAWAKEALVFEDCQSVASTTVPSHASMFTGLLPSTHRNDNMYPLLEDKRDTLAEILKRNGYASFLFSANPFISKDNNFDQGFDRVEHPWSDQHLEKATKIIRSKIDPEDKSTELPEKFKGERVESWAIKACGEVAQDGLLSWLDKRDTNRPFFAFINYMEAHRPLLPPRRLREKLMTPAQVARSYATDVSWNRMWEFVFGFAEYGPSSREAIQLTYDAAVAELDEHLNSLLTTLKQRGDLDNTIVIITADHGEHLCDHHLLDHQYSLYQSLLHVPLILWYPKQVAPGRSDAQVSNIDVFPTILELIGVGQAQTAESPAVSLLHPVANRTRPSDYLGIPLAPIALVKDRHPEWDQKSATRTLRAVRSGPYKLIWASDKHHALYDLSNDPDEQNNLFASKPEIANTMIAKLQTIDKRSQAQENSRDSKISRSHARRLMGLGYLGTNSNGFDE